MADPYDRIFRWLYFGGVANFKTTLNKMQQKKLCAHGNQMKISVVQKAIEFYSIV